MTYDTRGLCEAARELFAGHPRAVRAIIEGQAMTLAVPRGGGTPRVAILYFRGGRYAGNAPGTTLYSRGGSYAVKQCDDTPVIDLGDDPVPQWAEETVTRGVPVLPEDIEETLAAFEATLTRSEKR